MEPEDESAWWVDEKSKSGYGQDLVLRSVIGGIVMLGAAYLIAKLPRLTFNTGDHVVTYNRADYATFFNIATALAVVIAILFFASAARPMLGKPKRSPTTANTHPWMKAFWCITNVALIAFTGWTGIWGTSPDRLRDTGFIRSIAALGSDSPPLWTVAIVISLMSAVYTFFALRRAAVKGATFCAPSLDRSPFRAASDPLQALGMQFAHCYVVRQRRPFDFSPRRVSVLDPSFLFGRGTSLSRLAGYLNTLSSDRRDLTNR